MRKVSGGLLGIVLLCFFLPWITVSCNNNKIYSFSGINLVMGKKIQSPDDLFGPSKNLNKKESAKEKIVREWKAIIAFLAGIAGILTCFLIKANRVQGILTAVFGFLGGIFLFLLKNKFDSEMNEIITKSAGMINVEYHFGFWVSLLLFFVVGILNLLSFTNVFDRLLPGKVFNNLPASPRCSKCGAEVSPDDKVCSKCGHSLKEET
ncbi:hypothetical protein THC_0708 [Caldimicrobium thiodismutans]|uniref:Zinc-ribbon domain-containing protein n=1 Tax=Caldimicrobium thiodismutans TaxID=1653476 RepID=A0A0U5AGH6_9BACT|nr:zinc ribbon domain-containing protein [Caldimicrobium thiodismutans]BAU23100.1 hypothetical protein THC_0708 [Caldimicrobium thiodismutans]